LQSCKVSKVEASQTTKQLRALHRKRRGVQHTVTEWTSPPLRTSAQQLHAAMFRSARILQRMRGTAGAHKATTTAIRLSKRVVTQVNAVGTRRSLASVGAGEVDASKCVPLVSKHNSWPPFCCASYYCAPHRTLVLCLAAVTGHASLSCPFVASNTRAATHCVPQHHPSSTVWHASRAQWTRAC
jgi:hypothetical protein